MATSQENKRVELTLKPYGYDYSSDGYVGDESYYLHGTRVIKGTIRRATALARAYCSRSIHGGYRKFCVVEMIEIYLDKVLVKRIM